MVSYNQPLLNTSTNLDSSIDTTINNLPDKIIHEVNFPADIVPYNKPPLNTSANQQTSSDYHEYNNQNHFVKQHILSTLDSADYRSLSQRSIAINQQPILNTSPVLQDLQDTKENRLVTSFLALKTLPITTQDNNNGKTPQHVTVNAKIRTMNEPPFNVSIKNIGPSTSKTYLLSKIPIRKSSQSRLKVIQTHLQSTPSTSCIRQPLQDTAENNLTNQTREHEYFSVDIVPITNMSKNMSKIPKSVPLNAKISIMNEPPSNISIENMCLITTKEYPPSEILISKSRPIHTYYKFTLNLRRKRERFNDTATFIERYYHRIRAWLLRKF
ncbi:Hypothetical protein CINCED_3A012277 [Cinara cedri]|uniref:Uncharacterized protein n=1 Tax=Cinara cedri TaxID=506608 RepID=A0A5E4M7B4_9HEMI|nr:Hypothetical protein CINCED_3A012277 [Cinara cedri]